MNKRIMFKREFQNTLDKMSSNPMYAKFSKAEKEKELNKRI